MWADLLIAAGLIAMFGMGFWLGYSTREDAPPPPTDADDEIAWLWESDSWWEAKPTENGHRDTPPWGWRK